MNRRSEVRILATLSGARLRLLEREEARALRALAEAMPQAPPNAEPEQVLVAWCDSLARAVIDNPTSWRLMLMPAGETPLVMRKRVDAGRAVALEQIRSLVSPILDRRPDLAAIDHELAARMCLAAAAEGARLMLDAPAEFPPDRLTSFVVAVFTALGSEPTPHR